MDNPKFVGDQISGGKKSMFGFLKGIFQRNEITRPPRRTTSRKDWDLLNREIFSRVIEGGKFCVGVVSSGDAEPGQLKYRMSQDFPSRKAIEYIRAQFKSEQFNSIMTTRSGLALNSKYGLFKVASDKLGLPLNSMVMPVTSAVDPNLKSLLIFGGEFLDHQMAARLQTLDNLLGRGEKAAADRKLGAGGRTQRELIEKLEGINITRLFDCDINTLAEIANGLEEVKGQLSQNLKPKYGAVHQYLMKKRLN